MSAQLDSFAAISDADRERYIKHCGNRMLACMDEFARRGCFDAAGEAQLWRLRMESAIKGRSAEQVLRMEIQRGLV